MKNVNNSFISLQDYLRRSQAFFPRCIYFFFQGHLFKMLCNTRVIQAQWFDGIFYFRSFHFTFGIEIMNDWITVIWVKFCKISKLFPFLVTVFVRCFLNILFLFFESFFENEGIKFQLLWRIFIENERIVSWKLNTNSINEFPNELLNSLVTLFS